ncbi:MAG TPA: YebC/PmpR family DNA-binding transcriptional regulator [Clostridiales bacterium]|jgi:YebC/PmpR family DNA-binding regulatory protein|nr:YebC/PmpR family DNA-binding transcriptional regulator [Clostridiales bacterium]
MAGHSKWANIKNKKAKTDAQKGKIFTKLGREIAIAVKEGGSDPANNAKLRDVIAKAKASNMPNDNIMRSIKKAAGELGSVNYEEIAYEGYGPGGIAVIVDVVTDNRNRSASEIRHIFDKSGGSMGSNGCVAWKFDKKGVIVIEKTDKIDADELMMQAADAGCEDFVEEDDVFEIVTSPADFSKVREYLENANYEFLSAEIAMVPNDTVDLTGDAELAEKIERMLERFDDNDDVQNVYHNAILPDEE